MLTSDSNQSNLFGFANGGSSSAGRALDCDSSGRGFKSHLSPHGAPVAQLDRAFDFGSKGRGFESSRARHSASQTTISSNAPLKQPFPLFQKFSQFDSIFYCYSIEQWLLLHWKMNDRRKNSYSDTNPPNHIVRP